MIPRLLPASDRRVIAWKNGGGETIEIIVSPPHAGFDDFDWRVSIARLVAGGPFSSFPDVDRTLTILDGVMSLKIDRNAPVRLTPQSPPFAFPGDGAIEATVEAGPVTDINVMSRRGRCRHSVTRKQIVGPFNLDLIGDITIVIALSDGIEINGIPLTKCDALAFDEGAVAIYSDSNDDELLVVSASYLAPDCASPMLR